MLLSAFINNDLYNINKPEILKKVRDNSRLTLSFLVLLIGSSIVSTLGLLLNSTAIVIGGMIMSPLMWPLMQTAIGISYGRSEYIKRSLILLVFSILISMFSAYLIAYFSPIKDLNTEILSRTNPTLLDLVIAVVSGTIAVLAITQPKISESLAGVAVATSLMPPLCVAGIALALQNRAAFSGSYLLFLANVISIVLVAAVAFVVIGLKSNQEPAFQKRAFVVIALVFSLVAVPLYFYLRDFSAERALSTQARAILADEMALISQQIDILQIHTENQGTAYYIQADLLVPENIILTYEQIQDVQTNLEAGLNKSVSLDLRPQRIISVVSEYNLQLERFFLNEVKQVNPSITVTSIEISEDVEGVVVVKAVLRGTQEHLLDFQENTTIGQGMSSEFGKAFEINVEYVPVLTSIQSSDVALFSARQQLVELVAENTAIKLSDFEVSTTAEGDLRANVGLLAQSGTIIPLELRESIRSILTREFGNIELNLDVYYFDRTSL